jgi:hypothetical protein
MSGAGTPGRRFVMVRFAGAGAAALLLLVVAVTQPAAAEERTVETAGSDSLRAAAAPVQDGRPAALFPLYASFATLQVLDVHSTSSALSRGAVEANPAMKGLVGNQVGFAVMKAAGTAGIIFAAEKIRKKNKAAALGLMIASNSAMAWVVQHNYRAGW